MTTERDLLGDPVPVTRPVARQLALNLGMGVSVAWGHHSRLIVSLDTHDGTTRLTPVDLPDLGPRWAEALRRFYPGRKPGELDAKRCAQALGCEPRTAEGWGLGQAPRGEYLWRACRLHGRAFLAALAPELSPPTEAELLHAAEALRSTSAELAEAIGRLARDGGR